MCVYNIHVHVWINSTFMCIYTQVFPYMNIKSSYKYISLLTDCSLLQDIYMLIKSSLTVPGGGGTHL